MTSHGEEYNKFLDDNDELISFSLKDLNKITPVNLFTRFLLDDLREELVVAISNGSQSYIHRASIHFVRLGKEYLVPRSSDNEIEYRIFDKIIYIFTTQRMYIMDFLHGIAYRKYPEPILSEYFSKPCFFIPNKQIRDTLIDLKSKAKFDFKCDFSSLDRINLISMLLNHLNTDTEIKEFAKKLIREKLEKNINVIRILCRRTFPTSKELEEKRTQMSRETRERYEEAKRQREHERRQVQTIFRKNSKGIISMFLDSGVLRKFSSEEYSGKDQELMSRLQFFSQTYNTDIFWIKSETLHDKSQLIIVSDFFTISYLKKDRENIVRKLIPYSYFQGRRDLFNSPQDIFTREYFVSFVSYSNDLGEFIQNIFGKREKEKPHCISIAEIKIDQYYLIEENDNKILSVTIPHQSKRVFDKALSQIKPKNPRAIALFLIIRAQMIQAKVLFNMYFDIVDVIIQKG